MACGYSKAFWVYYLQPDQDALPVSGTTDKIKDKEEKRLHLIGY
jgi:hypothetical protein